MWTPICGHCFWDNDRGATAFCKKAGAESGKYIGSTFTPSNAIWIGICRPEDIENEVWPYCTGGCNSRDVGGSGCDASGGNGVKIECCKKLIDTFLQYITIEF